MKKLTLIPLLLVSTILFGCGDNSAAEDLINNAEGALSNSAKPMGRHFQSVLAAREARGWSVDEYDIEVVDSGNGIYKEREIEGAIIKVQIKFINREQGEYDNVCLFTAALDDTEFGYWRDIKSNSCSKMEDEITQWKNKNQFS